MIVGNRIHNLGDWEREERTQPERYIKIADLASGHVAPGAPATYRVIAQDASLPPRQINRRVVARNADRARALVSASLAASTFQVVSVEEVRP